MSGPSPPSRRPPRSTTRSVELLALGECEREAGEREPAREVSCTPPISLAGSAAPISGARRARLPRPAEMGTPSDPPTVALLDEALAAVGRRPVLRARLSAGWSARAVFGQHGDPGAVEREAVALARPSGDPAAMRTRSRRLWASLGPDAIDERLAVGRELLALGEREQSLC
jgi:hypothetical protein